MGLCNDHGNTEDSISHSSVSRCNFALREKCEQHELHSAPQERERSRGSFQRGICDSPAQDEIKTHT